MVAEGYIFHDFAILSIAFNDFLDVFLSEPSLIINEHDCLLFKEMIIWTRTIEKILFAILNEKSEFVTVLIYCYFSVIVKHFVPMMETITKKAKYCILTCNLCTF